MSIRKIGCAALLSAGVTLLPQFAAAQLSGLAQVLDEPSHLLHSSSPGYMGVLVTDVDSDSAAKLKLKEARGAIVTLIDHDAPAAQAGIRVNDVVLQVNGQTIESAEQFSRMIRETPAGHNVSLLISRDGNTQTIAVELCDRKKMEQDVWNRLDQGGTSGSTSEGNSLLGTAGAGDVPSSPGFHMPLFGSSLNVGALVEPLTSQMADYLNVQGGLMIKQVARKSEAEAAGLKAFDVILKVGTDSILTSADWDRALRANQNKPVSITILRDRKQQTVTLQVDSKHRRSELEDLFPDADCPLMASLDSNVALQLAQQFAGNDSAIQSMRNQAESLHDQLGAMQFSVSPEQVEQFQKQLEQQAEKFRQEFKDKNFKLDQKQMDELKRQMDEFSKSFKADNFKFDPKEMEQFNQQMRQFQSPDFQQKMREQMQREMDRLKRQLEEMQTQGFDHMV